MPQHKHDTIEESTHPPINFRTYLITSCFKARNNDTPGTIYPQKFTWKNLIFLRFNPEYKRFRKRLHRIIATYSFLKCNIPLDILYLYSTLVEYIQERQY